MNHQAIIERIEVSYTAFRELIASVPVERATDSVSPGEWSVRDIVGHIAWWEDRAAHDILGTAEAMDGQTVDQRNAVEYAAISERTLEESLLALDTAHELLTGVVRDHPEVTADQVEPDTWEHYEEHGADIRAWLESNDR